MRCDNSIGVRKFFTGVDTSFCDGNMHVRSEKITDLLHS